MQMQSTYWLEKVLKMIFLYVNALLCTLQHVIHAMQLSRVNSPKFSPNIFLYVFTEELSVIKCLWSPRSPDLSTCDFYLWGYLKGKVYANNPNKYWEDLKENIRIEILRIDIAELHRVYDNMLQRAQKCTDVQGDHFQHLL